MVKDTDVVYSTTRETESIYTLFTECNHLYLVKTNEGSNPDVLFFEKCDTFLSCVDGIHHNVVQSTTAGGNSHIILLIYCSKVSLQENK